MTGSGPLPPKFPPDWASAWGYDALSPYPFAELKLTPEVRIRFRWIPPGEFMMGSPEGEKAEVGRYGDEGPQHRVVLMHFSTRGNLPAYARENRPRERITIRGEVARTGRVERFADASQSRAT